MVIYLRNASNILRNSTRSLATVVSPSSPSGRSSAVSSASVPITISTLNHEGPLRPHLKLPVNPQHGLYGFFRLKTNENSHSKLKDDGEAEYVAVEPPDAVNSSGRSWSATELRRKSFKDLHTLWYILLRERNLLATQKAERKRLTAPPSLSTVYGEQAQKCRKSMAGIKAILTERRKAYIQAAQLRRVISRNPGLSESSKVTDVQVGVREGMLEAEAGQTKPPEREASQMKPA